MKMSWLIVQAVPDNKCPCTFMVTLLLKLKDVMIELITSNVNALEIALVNSVVICWLVLLLVADARNPWTSVEAFEMDVEIKVCMSWMSWSNCVCSIRL